MKQLVYAMRDRNTQLIKIGISVDPDTRARAVAKQFSADVELLGFLEVENARMVEQFMHAALKNHRILGEWFQPDIKTLSYLLAFFVKPGTNLKESCEAGSEPELKLKPYSGGENLNQSQRLQWGIRAYMAEEKITQKKLAEKINLSQAALSNALASERALLTRNAAKIIEGLNLNFTLTVTEKPKPENGGEA